jgi:hypothetical protein
MNICLVSLHTKDYQPLANLTWEQNKKLYCEKHGYGFAVAVCDTKKYIGFAKMFLIEKLMSDPNYDQYVRAL